MIQPEHEYILDFRFNLADGTPWAAAGHELAWEQFELAARKSQPQTAVEADLPLEVDRGRRQSDRQRPQLYGHVRLEARCDDWLLVARTMSCSLPPCGPISGGHRSTTIAAHACPSGSALGATPARASKSPRQTCRSLNQYVDGDQPAEACIKYRRQAHERRQRRLQRYVHRRRHRPGHGRDRLQAAKSPRCADAAALRHRMDSRWLAQPDHLVWSRAGAHLQRSQAGAARHLFRQRGRPVRQLLPAAGK